MARAPVEGVEVPGVEGGVKEGLRRAGSAGGGAADAAVPTGGGAMEASS